MIGGDDDGALNRLSLHFKAFDMGLAFAPLAWRSLPSKRKTVTGPFPVEATFNYAAIPK
jgi:hypothetical protein